MSCEVLRRFRLTKVHTGPLLHHLKRHAKDNTTEVAVGRAPSASKAAEPATSHVLRLELVVGPELGKLILDIVGVGRLATQSAQRLGSIVEAVMSNVPAGRLNVWVSRITHHEIQDSQHTSGSRNKPVPRIRAHANWIAMGIRYEPESMRFIVELLTTAASNKPMVMQN